MPRGSCKCRQTGHGGAACTCRSPYVPASDAGRSGPNGSTLCVALLQVLAWYVGSSQRQGQCAAWGPSGQGAGLCEAVEVGGGGTGGGYSGSSGERTGVGRGSGFGCGSVNDSDPCCSASLDEAGLWVVAATVSWAGHVGSSAATALRPEGPSAWGWLVLRPGQPGRTQLPWYTACGVAQRGAGDSPTSAVGVGFGRFHCGYGL